MDVDQLKHGINIGADVASLAHKEQEQQQHRQEEFQFFGVFVSQVS